MSTTSSAILAPAAIFSENLVKPLFGHKFSDKQFLVVTQGLCFDVQRYCHGNGVYAFKYL